MFDQQPFRFDPAGPASSYETFGIQRPRSPEAWVPATCEDVGCEAWRNGWVTRVPKVDSGGLSAAMQSAIRQGRLPAAVMDEPDALAYTFAPGTPCFRASTHRKLARPDIPDLFVVRGGDWRGNPRGTPTRVHKRPEDWAEHLHESTDAVAARLERG